MQTEILKSVHEKWKPELPVLSEQTVSRFGFGVG